MEEMVAWIHSPPGTPFGKRVETPEMAEQEMALFHQATKKLK